VQHLGHSACRSSLPETATGRKQLVEDDPETVNVAGRADRVHVAFNLPGDM